MTFSVIEIGADQVDVLLSLEEGHFLDMKAVDIAPASVTKSVSAFANTSGGELYIGIDEVIGLTGREWRWRGFNAPEDANGLIQALEGMAPLGNHYAIEFLRSQKQVGFVAHISVLKSKDILQSSNGKVYVRRGAQKLPVEGEDAMRRLRLDKGIASFEDEVVDIDPSEISNSETVINFMIRVVPTSEPDVWLEKQRVVANKKPTVAGVLLFSDEPQAILPKRSAVKLYRYTTKEEGERDTLAFDPITIEGPIYELVYATVEKCKEVVEGIKKLGPNGLEKITYPPEALHEIITNAILHRDYSIASDVHVRIFDNRIEIESPGRFPGHVTAENVLHEQFARNPKIVRLVNKFPDPPNKDVGEGLNTAYEAMGKLRLKPPVITEKDNSVLITLRHESLGSPEQIVMDYLETHAEITNGIARELTGIKSENTMKNVFYRLRDRQLIELIADRPAWRKKVAEG